MPGQKGSIWSCAVSNDSCTLAVCCDNQQSPPNSAGAIGFYDIASGVLRHEYDTNNAVEAVAFSVNGLVAICERNEIRLYDSYSTTTTATTTLPLLLLPILVLLLLPLHYHYYYYYYDTVMENEKKLTGKCVFDCFLCFLWWDLDGNSRYIECLTSFPNVRSKIRTQRLTAHILFTQPYLWSTSMYLIGIILCFDPPPDKHQKHNQKSKPSNIHPCQENPLLLYPKVSPISIKPKRIFQKIYLGWLANGAAECQQLRRGACAASP